MTQRDSLADLLRPHIKNPGILRGKKKDEMISVSSTSFSWCVLFLYTGGIAFYILFFFLNIFLLNIMFLESSQVPMCKSSLLTLTTDLCSIDICAPLGTNLVCPTSVTTQIILQ